MSLGFKQRMTKLWIPSVSVVGASPRPPASPRGQALNACLSVTQKSLCITSTTITKPEAKYAPSVTTIKLDTRRDTKPTVHVRNTDSNNVLQHFITTRDDIKKAYRGRFPQRKPTTTTTTTRQQNTSRPKREQVKVSKPKVNIRLPSADNADDQPALVSGPPTDDVNADTSEASNVPNSFKTSRQSQHAGTSSVAKEKRARRVIRKCK